MARWSLREREGSDTPSAEEFFWFHIMPGGTLRVIEEDRTEGEIFDYWVLSGLLWLGTLSYAATTSMSAAAAGGSSIAAEWAMFRNLQYLYAAAHAAPFVAASAAGVYTGMQIVEGSGIVPQTLEIAQGHPSKPWWMPLPVYVHLYG